MGFSSVALVVCESAEVEGESGRGGAMSFCSPHYSSSYHQSDGQQSITQREGEVRTYRTEFIKDIIRFWNQVILLW